MPAPSLLERLESAYHARADHADAFCEVVFRELCQLTEASKVHLSVPIEHRTKSWPSIKAKLERKTDVTDLGAITDFVGLRLIVRFRSQLNASCQLIRDNFEVVEEEDTSGRLNEDQFGYASTHFVVSLREDLLKLPTMAKFRGSVAEIQVRTTAQHIWADASHALQYKQESSVPPHLRRSMYRISALLELIDLEFERLAINRETYVRQLGLAVIADDTELNVDVLRSVLDASLPEDNRVPNEDYGALLEDLTEVDVTRVDQLRQLIVRQLTAARNKDSEIVELERHRIAKYRGELSTIDRDAPGRLGRGVFATHTGLVRVMIAYEFDPHYRGRKHE